MTAFETYVITQILLAAVFLLVGFVVGYNVGNTIGYCTGCEEAADSSPVTCHSSLEEERRI